MLYLKQEIKTLHAEMSRVTDLILLLLLGHGRDLRRSSKLGRGRHYLLDIWREERLDSLKQEHYHLVNTKRKSLTCSAASSKLLDSGVCTTEPVASRVNDPSVEVFESLALIDLFLFFTPS